MAVSGRFLTCFLLLMLLGVTASVGRAASPPRMRPYTGIGLVAFSRTDLLPGRDFQLPLYEEPGLSRVGLLDRTRLSGNEWIFGLKEELLPLVVSARKGDWLRVFYDDAGREAWIDPQKSGHFQSWEHFLKLQSSRMLPGLPQQYYHMLLKPGGKLLATLTQKQSFRVLKLENAWGMVLTEQSQIGWVRWRDDDGRLTVGAGKK